MGDYTCTASNQLPQTTVLTTASTVPLVVLALPDPTPTMTVQSPSTSSEGGLSTTAIAGISAGGAVLLICCIVVLVVAKKRRRRRYDDSLSPCETPPPSSVRLRRRRSAATYDSDNITNRMYYSAVWDDETEISCRDGSDDYTITETEIDDEWMSRTTSYQY